MSSFVHLVFFFLSNTRQENSTPPAKQVRRPATPEKHKGTVHSQPPAGMSTRGGKDKISFLQKLNMTNGGQPKPAW